MTRKGESGMQGFGEDAIFRRFAERPRLLTCCNGTVVTSYELHKFRCSWDVPSWGYEAGSLHFQHALDCPLIQEATIWTKRKLEVAPGLWVGVEIGEGLYQLKEGSYERND